jgi:hypothetical protein
MSREHAKGWVVLVVIMSTFAPWLPQRAAGYTETYCVSDPSVPGDWFDPGNWSNGSPTTSHWAYVHNGGTIEITGGDPRANKLSIGDGRVVQSDGYLRVGNHALWVGGTPGVLGSYELSGGTLRCDGTHGAFIGYWGVGQMTQTGGVFSLHNFLNIGFWCDGTYQVSGNSKIGGCGLHLSSGGGHGCFEQTGGDVTLDYVRLNGPRGGPPGTYDISAGSLAAIRLTVGREYSADFTQSAGSVSAREWLHIGGLPNGVGTYTISGGSLTVPDLYLPYEGRGTLTIADQSAAVTISNLFQLGPKGTFCAVPGTEIHMTGASLGNHSQDPYALAGLGNVDLVFEGGSGGLDTLEVAGEDLGPVAAGLSGNFALGALTLGGDDVGRVQLIDGFNNQPGSEYGEALYVRQLRLGPGSFLDLEGLHLYYLDAAIDDDATIVGGLPTQIPEPAALALLALGSATVLRRERRAAP